MAWTDHVTCMKEALTVGAVPGQRETVPGQTGGWHLAPGASAPPNDRVRCHANDLPLFRGFVRREKRPPVGWVQWAEALARWLLGETRQVFA